jgi:thiol:disulfide interchange protein
MKKHFLLFFLLLSINASFAQIVNPVSWKTSVEKQADDVYVLVLEAKIDPQWHVYSQHTPDGGPLPLMISLSGHEGKVEIIGKALESPYKKQFNEIFEVEEFYFANAFSLRQQVKSLAGGSFKVKVDYQVCKEVCINQEKSFTFEVPASELSSRLTDPGVIADSASAKTVVKPAVQPTSAAAANHDLWAVFALAFIGGLAALLTPCVFPMIPMTVSFFTKQSKTKAQGKRNAIIYGVSIILIYLVLGSAVTAIFGAKALNDLSTNVWFNIIFFLLLVIFAFSFLGAFEIVLPNSWANKVDRQADRGGIIGILFMALALAIVSFSCTGPIVGTLLVESASKGGIAPIIGMLGFSTALALPFMLFAMFPGWLNTLPKSGGWLNTVKVSLGFLELALALKFLSNADLVLQLHLLEREVFLAIWIAIFGVWGLYLLGKVMLPHDSPLPNISVGRLTLALVVLSFTVYMIPGLWGAPLKLISAFPPPPGYSESPEGVGRGSARTLGELPDGAEIGPHGLVTFLEYEKGLAYAKSVNKPVLLDFTGYACVNCRKMENNVWAEIDVLKMLRDDVVLVSLHVDDKRPLPKEQRTVSKESGEEITTIGNKWGELMITRFRTNTQPFYVLMDTNEQTLNVPIGYTSDAKEYAAWLKKGIASFKI